MLLLFACGKTNFKARTDLQYKVRYTSDSIIINDNTSNLKLHAKNGNYYTEDGDLFLTNYMDTIIVFRDVNNIWVIKRVLDKELYTNSCFHVKQDGQAILLVEYIYDFNYRIKGIKRLTTIEYY